VEAFFMIGASSGCVPELGRQLRVAEGVVNVWAIISGDFDFAVLARGDSLEQLVDFKERTLSAMSMPVDSGTEGITMRPLVDHVKVNVISGPDNPDPVSRRQWKVR